MITSTPDKEIELVTIKVTRKERRWLLIEKARTDLPIWRIIEQMIEAEQEHRITNDRPTQNYNAS